MNSPKVSFLALCYNHGPYLAQCLDSIIAQQWTNWELIILDNSSADDSAQRLQDWVHGRPGAIHLMLENQRRGICANLNLMLAQATGEYVALISTDDFWFPQKTAIQVEALERLGSSYAVAYSDAVCVDAENRPFPTPFIAEHRDFSQLPEGDILAELLRGPFIPAMSTLIRRNALVEIGGYDESLIYEDYDTWMRLATKWDFHAEPAALCAYRVLASSMIRTVAKQDRPEKILSDARIMAKASLIERLEPKARINLQRRVVKLTCQLLTYPGDWKQAVMGLRDLSGLACLCLPSFLKDQNEKKPPTQEEVYHALAQAATVGTMEKKELDVLPLAVLPLIQNLQNSLQQSKPLVIASSKRPPFWKRWFPPSNS